MITEDWHANKFSFHCSDCITRSAMYCAAHNAIEQAKLEQGSDLFQIIKTLRIQRPGSIPSQVRNNCVFLDNDFTGILEMLRNCS